MTTRPRLNFAIEEREDGWWIKIKTSGEEISKEGPYDSYPDALIRVEREFGDRYELYI